MAPRRTGPDATEPDAVLPGRSSLGETQADDRQLGVPRSTRLLPERLLAEDLPADIEPRAAWLRLREGGQGSQNVRSRQTLVAGHGYGTSNLKTAEVATLTGVRFPLPPPL